LNIIYPFIFIFIFTGCAGTRTKTNMVIQTVEYSDLKNSFISCSGKGRIISTGSLNGIMTFSFISQRDSSFLQFKDPFGRKALLMWFTPVGVNAWNIIENKKYNYEQILNFFPFLQIVKPHDVTKLLWGVRPNYDTNLDQELSVLADNITLEFKEDKIGNIDTPSLYLVTFEDKNLNQSVKIKIQNRILNPTEINIKTAWELIQS